MPDRSSISFFFFPKNHTSQKIALEIGRKREGFLRGVESFQANDITRMLGRESIRAPICQSRLQSLAVVAIYSSGLSQHRRRSAIEK